jgi:hypothetical protein
MEILASACVLSRLDSEIMACTTAPEQEPWHSAGHYFLLTSLQRIRAHLTALQSTQTEDQLATRTADLTLWPEN